MKRVEVYRGREGVQKQVHNRIVPPEEIGGCKIILPLREDPVRDRRNK